ncbi:TPA: hypothetical protein ACLA92_002153, partial [Neisseria meningitidis]
LKTTYTYFFVWLCFGNLLISIIFKGKDNYFPVRNKPILLNTLKPSMSINTILKHSQNKKSRRNLPAAFSIALYQAIEASTKAVS